MATQIFIIPLLFPYFFELGLIFFLLLFHEELLYLLIPGTLTWPAQQKQQQSFAPQRLWWMEQPMVLPKEACEELAWLQGCTLA